jgi:hypothetical protein
MERWSSWTGKRMALLAAVAVLVAGTTRGAMAQDAAGSQPDPLKFATSAPVIVGWIVKADKAADFESGWAGIRGLLAKAEDSGLQALGQSLNSIYKVNQPPFELQGNQAVIYIFKLDSPSTAYSYNPRTILYEYLKAGLEGSSVARAEADDLYGKLQVAFLNLNPIWTLTKVG